MRKMLAAAVLTTASLVALAAPAQAATKHKAHMSLTTYYPMAGRAYWVKGAGNAVPIKGAKVCIQYRYYWSKTWHIQKCTHTSTKGYAKAYPTLHEGAWYRWSLYATKSTTHAYSAWTECYSCG
ncbi:MAG: hypothetical protein JWN52_1989 [Actinomycetia bacterium]|nr:hypothetical protein [Actinomycetes bacterium]